MGCSIKPKETDIDAFTGELREIPAPNFSYEEIPSGCCIKIFEFQQMILHQEIKIDGLLIVDGTLVILD